MFENVARFLIFLAFSTCVELFLLDKEESQIALELMKKLKIRHCIFFRNETSEVDTFEFKKLSSEKIFASFVRNHDQFLDHVKKSWQINHDHSFPAEEKTNFYRTMIVLKNKDLEETKEIFWDFYELNNVSFSKIYGIVLT